ncbi:MAG: chemotaxis protein CheA [Tissierellia bacterium]|nr:chemotaxis protein CheA [Tissierellia bacterium]
MESDLKQYMNLFIEESKEHLQSMNDALLVLEKEKNNRELINEIFRVAHTLKGMAGTMGFTNMANLTHEMENVLDEIRNKGIKLSEDIVDILFECFDALDEIISYISEKGEEIDEQKDELISKLRGILKEEKIQESIEKGYDKEDKRLDEFVLNVIAEAKEKGFNPYKIQVYLRPDCMLKSARAFIVFNLLEKLGTIVYSNPSVEDIEDEKFDFSFTIILLTNATREELIEEIYGISEIDNVEVDLIQIEEKNKEKKIDNEKEMIMPNAKKEEKISNMRVVQDQGKKRIAKTVRVDIERLDSLMNLVSELIIVKTRIDELKDNSNIEEMTYAIEYLERITTSLHDAVMKVRMVPIERVFNRFPRMVRDLSKELDKKVNLVMHGENTEVDRTVIDEIGDPLIHLIRNSLDHGIEKTEDRIKLGKSEVGNILLKAYPDGNNVVIELSDDGNGIDFNKVKEKAVQIGLCTYEEVNEFSEEDLKNMLFEPGFSTSESITELSGRGVGLDVVKNKIESINGSIELETVKNKGTKFTIRIPLTLAIIQALLIKVANETYAIPLSSITEIIIIDKDNIRNLQGQEITLYRGKTIPIVRLDKLLGLNADEMTNEHIAVVVRKGDKEAALLVTSLIGQQEIVIKPLGKYLSNIRMFSGATILGNGNISLIIDVNSLI